MVSVRPDEEQTAPVVAEVGLLVVAVVVGVVTGAVVWMVVAVR